MTKTFEGAIRADAQSMDPMDLVIVGGQSLPPEERGPFDTKWDEHHPLHVHDLLKPLDPLDVESVFQLGVIVPIEVIRIGDRPHVCLGRGRVRKARVANARRKAKGLPPILVKFTVVRITDRVELQSRIIDENLRRKTPGVLDQIAMAKQLMAFGADEQYVAKKLGISLERFSEWLRLEDNSTEKVREALRAERLSPSAAITLAELDGEAQDEALDRLLSSPQPTARAAKKIVREAKGRETVVRPKPADHRRLLAAADKNSRGNEFMQGVKAAMRWAVGDGVHKDIAKLLNAEGEEG